MDPNIRSVAVPRTRRRHSTAGQASEAVSPVAVTESRPPRRRAAIATALAPLYGVGDNVTLLGGGNRWARVQSTCRVLAILPPEGGPFQYRIRSDAENYERIVVETDLAPSA